MTTPPIIAIDGPAAAGKGTLARRLAVALGLPYLDTGLLYRATGRRVLDAGGDPADPAAAAAAARALRPEDTLRVDLRGPVADAAAAAVAAIPAVRAALLDFQRDFGRTNGAVLDGRDIGTVIFPDAPVKIFVTASLAERARRRFLELQAKGTPAPFDQVEADMRARDAQDAARAAAPLKAADDAVILDTTEMDADAAFARALALTRARLQSAPRDMALATLLAGLRRDGRQQSGLDDALLPADADAAYRVAALVERLLGWPRAGWKIAANMPEMQHALRAAEPIMGRVFARFLHDSPARLDAAKLLHPVVEAEIAICLAADLPPRAAPYTEADILAAIASIHPAIEVAECRFLHDARFPPLPAILADGSGSGSLILGPAIADWRSRDIPAQDVALRVDGVERRRGNVAKSIGSPITPVTWLANRLSADGIGLRAGEVISTGTCTGMLLGRAGQTFLGDFGPLGTVTVTLAA